MVGYSKNHTRDTYKLYNQETKRVIMTRGIIWADWKNTDPAETLKMFREAEKEYLVPGIQEDVIPMSKTEENIPMHVISDEVERVRSKEISEKSSELTYLNKDADADTLLYGRVFNALKKLDTPYSPTMQRCTIQSLK